MTITLSWTPTGAAAGATPAKFVLADSPANVPMKNFRINGSRSIQEDKGVRAVAVTLRDRLNRKTTVSFETARGFDTEEEADAFMLRHETMFAGQFTVTFVGGLPGQTVTTSMVGAVVEAVDSGQIGCTTTHSYRIVGGIMN